MDMGLIAIVIKTNWLTSLKNTKTHLLNLTKK